MTPNVKICGLSTPESVHAALAGGAAYIGFVFFAQSPRNIAPADAARLAAPAASRGVKTVAVTVDAGDEALDGLVSVLRPDYLQMHGSEPPSRVREVSERLGVSVIKAASVVDAADIRAAVRQYDGVADHLMFDAKAPERSERPGGNGLSVDWELLKGLRLERPWFLAGGLDPWNVADAVSRSGATLLDVSSGVERGAGLKDPALIASFLSAARRG